MQKANDASIEKNRAIVATLNAEVRRQKTALKAELPKLEKLAYKKVKHQRSPLCTLISSCAKYFAASGATGSFVFTLVSLLRRGEHHDSG